MTSQEMLAMQYKILGHKSVDFTELRWFNKNKEINVLFVKGIERVIYMHESFVIDATNDFIGINPRNKTSGKSEDIDYVTCIIIDIDPIRSVGEGSTNEQHEAAIKLGHVISKDFPNSVVIDSGGGCHIYLPIIPIKLLDTKHRDLVSQNIKRLYEQIKVRYNTNGFKIDHIQDPARCIRVWGSWNKRSGRQCVPLNVEGLTEFPRTEFKLEEIKQEKALLPPGYTNHRFEQLLKNHLGLNQIMSGKTEFPSASEANMAFVSYLTKAQFPLAEIKELAKLNPLVADTNKNAKQFEQDVERIVSKVRGGSSTVSLLHNNEKYVDDLEARHTGISTGFKRLDDMLSGIQKGKLYVLAARTNEGKTSFACNLAYNLVSKNVPVLFFPTELGHEPLFDKVVAQATDIDLKRFQSGNLTTEHKAAIRAKMQEISQYPFIVKEDFSLTLETVKRTVNDTQPGFIIVDYIQAFKYEEGGTPQEIGKVMRGLKELNESTGIPMLVCSQLNRAAIGNELSLGQLKGSGSIEEFADVVMALSTLSKYEYPRPVEIFILKSRYSEIGKQRLEFFSSVGKFKEKE